MWADDESMWAEGSALWVCLRPMWADDESMWAEGSALWICLRPMWADDESMWAEGSAMWVCLRPTWAEDEIIWADDAAGGWDDGFRPVEVPVERVTLAAGRARPRAAGPTDGAARPPVGVRKARRRLAHRPFLVRRLSKSSTPPHAGLWIGRGVLESTEEPARALGRGGRLRLGRFSRRVRRRGPGSRMGPRDPAL
jgi:hypothetical protein